MATCPFCQFENIDGADVCEKCEASLDSLSKPRPTSVVERRVMKGSIADLVPREPLVVAPTTPLGEVLARMADRNVGCAVIVADHNVAGIFTERDALLRLNVDAASLADRPVSEFMTAAVETLELDDRIAFALHRMDVGGFRHIPILSHGRVTGVISARDILDHISAALRQEPA